MILRNARVEFVALLAWVLASLFVIGGCGSTGPYVWYNDLPKNEWGPQAFGASTSDYVIGIGDALSIKVYEQDNLATAAKVRTDGRVALTLIGEVIAAGKRPSALARELEGRLKEFIVSPRVTVNVEQSQPVSISLVGEIGHSGALTLDSPASLLQAMALAGGPSEFADRSRIFVIRRFPEFKRIRFTYEALLENQGGAASFALRTGDIILVE